MVSSAKPSFTPTSTVFPSEESITTSHKTCMRPSYIPSRMYATGTPHEASTSTWKVAELRSSLPPSSSAIGTSSEPSSHMQPRVLATQPHAHRSFVAKKVSLLLKPRLPTGKNFSNKEQIMPINPVREKLNSAGDVKLHYVQWGEQGKPIVCVHGLTANAFCFQAFADDLSRDHRFFAYDLRGRGDSDKPQHGYSVPI